jgi:nucleotide-binding universal stress UspA family protein
MISNALDAASVGAGMAEYSSSAGHALTEKGYARILVATDTSHAAGGALRVADLLATGQIGAVELVGVVDLPHSNLEPSDRALSADMLESMRSRVRAQLGDTLGDRPTWKVTADVGAVSETICRTAEEHDAELVILGLGQHRRRCDRPAGDATALKVARKASTPVLIVPSSADHLPSNVMVCMDFSCASIRAARAALGLVRTPAVFHFVYVEPDFQHVPTKATQVDDTREADLESLFAELELRIRAPWDVSFQHVAIPVGDPASELLAYASANAIDLIVAGTHSTATPQCTTLGSVSTRLIRSAQCAVLVSGWINPDSSPCPGSPAWEDAIP